MYPIEKYKFFTQETPRGVKTIAVTTYAGKTVRGTALCAPSDVYDEETGKKIAAARCNLKVAEKRLIRAEHKYHKAKEAEFAAARYVEKMDQYWEDADDAYWEANGVLEDLIN